MEQELANNCTLVCPDFHHSCRIFLEKKLCQSIGQINDLCKFSEFSEGLPSPRSLDIIQKEFPENTKENSESDNFDYYFVLNLDNVIE